MGGSISISGDKYAFVSSRKCKNPGIAMALQRVSISES